MSKLIENIKRLAAMIKGETQSGGNTAVRVGGLFEDISSELELKYDRAESDRILSVHDTSDVSHQNIQDKINESIESLDQKQTDALSEHAGTLTIHKTSEQIRGEIVDKDIPATLARVADVDAKDAVILSDAKKYATDHVDMLSNDVYHKAESYNRTEIDNKDAAVLNNSKEYVTAKIAELVNGSPAALDTLYEIANAMNNDPNFGTSVIAMINGKSDLVHSHTKSQITDFPTSLPANGGNADTVDGKHAADFQVAGSYAPGNHNHTGIYQPVGNYAASTHNHTKSQITDFPASLPASDVSAWAKAAAKPGYTAAEVGASASGHNHAGVYQPVGSYAASTHNHTKNQITDFPASLPASDVHAWAKAAAKPGYTAAEVGASASGHNHAGVYQPVGSYAASTHNHTKNQITDFPASLPASDVFAWAKAAAKPGYTAAEVGAAASGHNHAGVYAGSSHSHSAGQVAEETNKRFMTDAERVKLSLDYLLRAQSITSNINNIKDTGIYTLNAGASNVPDSAIGSMLLHLSWDANCAYQLCFGYDTGRVYVRMKKNGSWLAWFYFQTIQK